MAPLSSKLIFTVFVVLYVGARSYWASKAEKRPAQESRIFTWDRVNIGLVGVFTNIVSLLALYTSVLSYFDYPPQDALTFLSLPFLLGGLILFWIAHRDLGENWSVSLSIKKDHMLITNGIFNRIRHPMYTSIWLCAIGQALCIPNYVGGLGGLVTWAILYFVRINKEEQMMIEKFGDQYRDYMKRTKRLIPGVC